MEHKAQNQQVNNKNNIKIKQKYSAQIKNIKKQKNILIKKLNDKRKTKKSDPLTKNQQKFITSPIRDTIFKETFKNSKDALIHLLNSIRTKLQTNHQFPEITNVLEVRVQHMVNSYPKLFVDLYCKDCNDNIFIIEMQQAKQEYIKNRAELYKAATQLQAYKTTIDNEMNNYKSTDEEKKRQQAINKAIKTLPTIHVIVIMNFELKKNGSYLEFQYTGEKDDKGNQINENYQATNIYIYLPALRITKETDKSTFSDLEKWIYFFTHMNELTEEEIYQLITDDKTNTFNIIFTNYLDKVENYLSNINNPQSKIDDEKNQNDIFKELDDYLLQEDHQHLQEKNQILQDKLQSTENELAHLKDQLKINKIQQKKQTQETQQQIAVLIKSLHNQNTSKKIIVNVLQQSYQLTQQQAMKQYNSVITENKEIGQTKQ